MGIGSTQTLSVIPPAVLTTLEVPIDADHLELTGLQISSQDGSSLEPHPRPPVLGRLIWLHVSGGDRTPRMCSGLILLKQTHPCIIFAGLAGICAVKKVRSTPHAHSELQFYVADKAV